MAQNSVAYSRMMNEYLYGTIKHGDVFFLLEYNRTHSNRAWDDADIPQAVKDKLKGYRNSRSVLIRQPGQIGEVDHTLTLFIVHAAAYKPVIYRYSLYDYNEIMTLNIDEILLGDIVEPMEKPLFAVCTNGKRDVCCSQFGIPVYNALMTSTPEAEVWQASHIGGHRFAGTLYAFPHAYCYGYLTAEDAPAVGADYMAGKVTLDYLRGRAVYDQPIQAAEYYLRRHLNDLSAIDGVQFNGYRALADDHHAITFSTVDAKYRVVIAEGAALRVLATTGTENYKHVPQWEQVSIHTPDES